MGVRSRAFSFTLRSLRLCDVRARALFTFCSTGEPSRPLPHVAHGFVTSATTTEVFNIYESDDFIPEDPFFSDTTTTTTWRELFYRVFFFLFCLNKPIFFAVFHPVYSTVK